MALVQLATNVGPVVAVGHVVVNQLLADVPVMGVQVATPVGPVVAKLHTVVTAPDVVDPTVQLCKYVVVDFGLVQVVVT